MFTTLQWLPVKSVMDSEVSSSTGMSSEITFSAGAVSQAFIVKPSGNIYSTVGISETSYSIVVAAEARNSSIESSKAS